MSVKGIAMVEKLMQLQTGLLEALSTVKGGDSPVMFCRGQTTLRVSPIGYQAVRGHYKRVIFITIIFPS